MMRALGIGMLCLACEPTNVGYAPMQPIPFSHAIHAVANQIPCQYCHYNAARSRHAGIPEATLCMNCHKVIQKDNPEIIRLQNMLTRGETIAWVQVHQLPDHVYFNHSAHVNRDVACQTCHGPVESMAIVEQSEPLTMGFCLDCHRTQGPYEMPDMALAELSDCAVCHH